MKWCGVDGESTLNGLATVFSLLTNDYTIIFISFLTRLLIRHITHIDNKTVLEEAYESTN